jgi:hypothetical protein
MLCRMKNIARASVVGMLLEFHMGSPEIVDTESTSVARDE